MKIVASGPIIAAGNDGGEQWDSVELLYTKTLNHWIVDLAMKLKMHLYLEEGYEPEYIHSRALLL